MHYQLLPPFGRIIFDDLNNALIFAKDSAKDIKPDQWIVLYRCEYQTEWPGGRIAGAPKNLPKNSYFMPGDVVQYPECILIDKNGNTQQFNISEHKRLVY